MRSSIKKITALGCSAVLLMGLAFPVSAAEAPEKEMSAHMQMVLEKDSTYEGFLENDEMLTAEEIEKLDSVVQVSEFDKLEALQQQPDSSLYEVGMTKKEIKDFKNSSVKNMVLENANKTLSDEQMEKDGLEKDTIQNIRNENFDDVTEAEARALTAELTLGIGNCARAGNSCNYNVYWHWDRYPTFNYTDVLASSISDGYSVGGNSTAKIGYANVNTTTPIQYERIYPVGAQEGGVARFDIDMELSNGLYAQSGKAFVGNTGYYSPDYGIRVNAEYFHNWLGALSNVSISPVGHISFTPKSGELTTIDPVFVYK